MIKILKPYYHLCFLLWLVAFTGAAQQRIEWQLSKTTILPGEPFTATVTITGQQPHQATVPDSLGKFEVLQKSAVTTSKANGQVLSTQTLVLTGFDTGKWRLPAIAVAGMPGLKTNEPDVLVKMLPADSTVQYHSLKELTSLKPEAQWPYWLALALASLLFAYGLWRLWRRRKTGTWGLPLPQQPALPLAQAIEQLAAQWQQGQLSSPQMAEQLMAIWRRLLQQQGINAQALTADELIIESRSRLSNSTFTAMAQSLRLCTLVRFARLQASPADGLAAIESTRLLLPHAQPQHQAYLPQEGATHA